MSYAALAECMRSSTVGDHAETFDFCVISVSGN